MDSIGGMLNPDGEMPKNTLQKGILLSFYWKKIMVYNVILTETIGISVMFLLGFYSFFSRVDTKGCCRRWRCTKSEETARQNKC